MTYALWGLAALTPLIDIVVVVWLWRDDGRSSVPGRPSAMKVGRVTLSGPAQMWIVVGLFLCNVTMIIALLGLLAAGIIELVRAIA